MKKLSLAGEMMLKKFEGLRLKPYQDEVGKFTIGYGHLIKNNEGYLFRGIDENTANKLFVSDKAEAENIINSIIKKNLTQSQFDALVSFAFNIGKTKFKNSTIVALINNNASDTLISEWIKSHYKTAGGNKSISLEKRRATEASLWNLKINDFSKITSLALLTAIGFFMLKK